MLTIIKGSIEEVKKEMKSAKAEAYNLRKQIYSQLKPKWRRLESLSIRDQKTVQEADMTLAFCEVSKFNPVYVELPGVKMLVNYLMLKELGKKLKGYRVYASYDYNNAGRVLILEYFKGTNKGRFELNELPDVFNIPKGKIPEARFDDHISMVCDIKEVM